jgi:hypothetical protein
MSNSILIRFYPSLNENNYTSAVLVSNLNKLLDKTCIKHLFNPLHMDATPIFPAIGSIRTQMGISHLLWRCGSCHYVRLPLLAFAPTMAVWVLSIPASKYPKFRVWSTY